MVNVQGDMPGIRYGRTVNGAGVATGSMLVIEPKEAVNFLQRLSITYGALTANSMGLISYGTIGTNRKVKFAQLTNATPHMIRPRGNKGCIWEPVGNIGMRVDEFPLMPIKYQGQMCPDNFWGTCLESLMGVGNQIEDILGSETGRKLVAELIASIYESLGDSIWNLAWFAEHPLITAADTANSFTVDLDEWTNFKAQQIGVGLGGWMTLVDANKASNKPHYNIQIKNSDVTTGGEFTGNVSRGGGLFERLVNGASKKLRLFNSRTVTGRVGGAAIGRTAILVTRAIFEQYERELALDFPTIPAQYYYFLTQNFINQNGLTDYLDRTNPANGVLVWKGHLIMMQESWDFFYEMLGYDAHIAMMAAPGVFGLAYDVPSLAQYEGLGMVIEQKKEAPDLGKIYMHTNLEMGMGIVNDELIAYASLILPKETV